MHRQISIDLGRRTTKVRAAEMARGWGEVGWHPTPGDAIAAGTRYLYSMARSCCATLGLPDDELHELSGVSVPAEEAREDPGAEEICFHIYSERVDNNEDD